MDLVPLCATQLKSWLQNMDPKNQEGSIEDKVIFIFNCCSVLMISSTLLWTINLFPTRAAFIIGGAAFFGRKVVENLIKSSGSLKSLSISFGAYLIFKFPDTKQTKIDLIDQCAAQLIAFVTNSLPPPRDHGLKFLFNICSVSMIFTSLFWTTSIFSTRGAFALLGAAFFGRKVIENALAVKQCKPLETIDTFVRHMSQPFFAKLIHRPDKIELFGQTIFYDLAIDQ